ncbi:MAG: hypothetical protein NT076_05765 [Candidatus Pacearchaeota archaeon]|nr:hypothetical protein [Candidatus Pacearchaeota archaeon]
MRNKYNPYDMPTFECLLREYREFCTNNGVPIDNLSLVDPLPLKVRTCVHTANEPVFSQEVSRKLDQLLEA